jgi:hypothetical protein
LESQSGGKPQQVSKFFALVAAVAEQERSIIHEDDGRPRRGRPPRPN